MGNLDFFLPRLSEYSAAAVPADPAPGAAVAGDAGDEDAENDDDDRSGITGVDVIGFFTRLSGVFGSTKMSSSLNIE